MMNKIYVGNLPYRITEQDVEAAFNQYGPIENVMLIKDRATGRLKGFGFVTFETEAAAQDALKMDGKDFQGRPLKVSIAREKTEGGGGSRGGREGGRGGAGGARRW
ncbi:MAG: RNA-binding protein [Proteobacteria bacterium]|nr:RNA-binding protein [Pseudomonadota bacterium]